MINEVLVKSMVMLNMEIEDIENVFENDLFDTQYPEQFFVEFKNKSFKCDIALVFIYKYKLKYKEAFDILEKYLNESDKNPENKKAKSILETVLTGFGKNSEYTDEFEHGLRILLKNDFESAFKIVLSNEIISIDNFLKILDDVDKDNPKTSKKESFLKNYARMKNIRITPTINTRHHISNYLYPKFSTNTKKIPSPQPRK